MYEIVRVIFTTRFLAGVFRLTTPIVFASMSCLIAKKAGVRNITIEGTMLCSALTGVIVSAFTQNVWLGLAAGTIAGVGIGLFLGYPYFDGYGHLAYRNCNQPICKWVYGICDVFGYGG